MNTQKNFAMTATYFTFNHFDKTIVGSEFNFKMSGNPTKPQYEALMNAMAMHPNYTLAPIAPEFAKQSYKGLTFDLMMEYVELKGTATIKAEFEEIVDSNATYPTIKSWFLDYFKVGFTVEKAKREIEIAKRNAKKKSAEEALKNQKATVRKVVKAKMVKAEEAKASTPIDSQKVINF